MSSYLEAKQSHSQMQSHRIGELLPDNSVFLVKLPNVLKNMMAKNKSLDLSQPDFIIGTMQNVRVHCGEVQDDDDREIFGSDSESNEANAFQKIEGTIVFLGKRAQMEEMMVSVDVELPLVKQDPSEFGAV